MADQTRTSKTVPAPAPTDPPAAAKGRPTPTRKEAEAARRERIRPNLSPAEKKKAEKEARKAERQRAYQGMVEGDDRYLNARDAGPVRAFVRDAVDSRLLLSEFFLPVTMVILVASVAGSLQVRAWANSLFMALMIVFMLEIGYVLLRIRKQVKVRFPDNDKGYTFYTIARATQLRRMRVPRPRVKRGDSL